MIKTDNGTHYPSRLSCMTMSSGLGVGRHSLSRAKCLSIRAMIASCGATCVFSRMTEYC